MLTVAATVLYQGEQCLISLYDIVCIIPLLCMLVNYDIVHASYVCRSSFSGSGYTIIM